MITLIIVDCQNDFITGSVTIPGAKNIVNNIKDLIKKKYEEIEKIIFVLDWHPVNHCSFKSQGGSLVQHCVQYTPGACIEPKLLKLIHSYELPYEVVLKGTYSGKEQNGAFEDIEKITTQLGTHYCLDYSATLYADSTPIICGITGNCDVRATIENLLYRDIKPLVFKDGIISTDDGNTLNRLIESRELKIYE